MAGGDGRGGASEDDIDDLLCTVEEQLRDVILRTQTLGEDYGQLPQLPPGSTFRLMVETRERRPGPGQGAAAGGLGAPVLSETSKALQTGHWLMAVEQESVIPDDDCAILPLRAVDSAGLKFSLSCEHSIGGAMDTT